MIRLKMKGKGMVQTNTQKKEYLVLSMVKKYPDYSLDRLTKELPGISRHSTQRILERNDLSTIQKRLSYAQTKNKGSKFQPGKYLNVEMLKRRWQMVGTSLKGVASRVPKKTLAGAAGTVLLVFIFWRISPLFGQMPEIELTQPGEDWVNRGENLFVIGRVTPNRTRVKVNDQDVALNGDGTFTAVINIPLGESVLKVEANSRGRRATLLRLVSRGLTEEESQAKAEEEAKRQKVIADESAELDKKVKDLLAAKQAGSVIPGFLRVLNNHVEEEEGFAKVVGEVVNLGKENAVWVMVRVDFFNENEVKVDSTYGFATEFDQVLRPKDRVKFETQPTRKEFAFYKMEISWEKEKVAGASDEVEQATSEATPATPAI